MSAEDREQERGTPPAPSAPGVSMRALLASRAAADAVSKPPSDGHGRTDAHAADAGDVEEASPGGAESAAAGVPARQPEQDAA